MHPSHFFCFEPVPRPPTSSLFPYTTLFRSSCISTMKVECPRAMLSDAPTRAKIRSTTGIFASRAGTNEPAWAMTQSRSEEHTSELQSRFDLVCRLLLEKKKEHDTHAGRRQL